ncbi:MAG: hypothetical protein AB2421_04400 [Thermotaleaceae bacterium]
MNRKKPTKYFLSLSLALLLVISSISTAFAAPGDIIHTGLKKIYRIDNENSVTQLLQDIQTKANVDLFYKEVENGQYINMVEQENLQYQALENYLNNITFNTAEEKLQYIQDNLQEIGEALARVSPSKKDFADISNVDFSEYTEAGTQPKALLLTSPGHYSTPESGDAPGTTKLAVLQLPNNAGKWLIKVSDAPMPAPSLDAAVASGFTSYAADRDIAIEPSQYIQLLATNDSSQVKAYANIQVAASQIQAALENALPIDSATLGAGKEKAGTCIITGLPDIGNIPEASQWLIKVQDTAFPASIYKNSVIVGTSDYTSGDEISIVTGDALHPISSALTKYMILVAADAAGRVKGYQRFTITAASLSPAPNRLILTTNYQAPTPGSNQGSTKLSGLHPGNPKLPPMDEATMWAVKVQSSAFDIPARNSVLTDISTTAPILQSLLDNISIAPGQHMLLAAIDDNNQIKGYRIFNSLTAAQIKGNNAPLLQLDTNYSAPEYGSANGTIKISTLKFDGLTGSPNTWRYKLFNEPVSPPAFDSILTTPAIYTAGSNIPINPGQYLLLVATDSSGKIKGYVIIKGTDIAIRPASAIELQATTHYSQPVKGDSPGTTKIENLSFGLSRVYPMTEASKWYYKVQEDAFEVPILNTKLNGTNPYTAGGSIPAALGQRLILLATDDDENIKGYKIFTLTENQVRAGNTPELETVNFSIPEPGSLSGTTKIATLSFTGLSGATGWRYKVQNEAFSIPEWNSVISGATNYTQGANIPIAPGQNLLLLAVDSSSRVKGYKIFTNLESSQIKVAIALQLAQTTHYTLPEPGIDEGSTKFRQLSFGAPAIPGATKWYVKVQANSFEAPGFDTMLPGAMEYTMNTSILKEGEKLTAGQRLLLLATDDVGKIKAYKEFTLTANQIRSPNAPVLPESNFHNDFGSLPGTTRFTTLSFFGLSGATAWRYVVAGEIFSEPGLDSTLVGTTLYSEGQNIPIISGQYLILLATDSAGKIKGYRSFSSADLKITAYAPLLTAPADYGIAPGSAIDTMRLTGLAEATDSKWQVIVQGSAYPAPAVGTVLNNSTLSNYRADTNIPVTPGQHVILFKTDNANKIQAFADIVVSEAYIQKATASILNKVVPEGAIMTGGESIAITLGTQGDAKWAADIRSNSTKRNALFDGLKTTTEALQWAKVITALKNDGQGAITRNGDTELTIHLPQTLGYDIATEQIISITLPGSALEGGLSPVQVSGTLTIKPTIGATLSGTLLTAPTREGDIKTGGKTMVIDLTDGTWVGDVATNLHIREKIFEGMVPTSEADAAGWNKVVDALKATASAITRNTGSRITITFPAVADYTLTSGVQSIRMTLPPEAVVDNENPIVASPSFSIMPNILQVAATATDSTVTMAAPENRVVRSSDNSWTLKITMGTLKTSIAASDLIFTGLPQGLTANAVKQDTDSIVITLSGTASTAIGADTTVKVRIKGNAVTEADALNSEEISLGIARGTPLAALQSVTMDVANNKLLHTTFEMEYSNTSTNGINGTWIDCSPTDTTVDFKAGKVYVREKAQPTVYREVAILSNGPAPMVTALFTETPGLLKLAGVTVDMEYSLNGGGTWSNVTPEIAAQTTGMNITSDEDLRVRIKATSEKLPSLATGKLNGINLSGAAIHVSLGKITGTTGEMQYSLNSTNGNDGSWTNCTATDTNVTFAEGSVYIREKNRIGNFRKLGEVTRETIDTSVLGKIDYHIANEEIILEDSLEPGLFEYRIGGASWKPLGPAKKTGGIGFQPGSLEIRHRGSNSSLPSQGITKVVIPAPGPVPAITSDDVQQTITKEISSEPYQYKIGTGDWLTWPEGQSTISFNITANTTISVRKGATKEALASQILNINFTPKLDFSGVGIHVAAGQLTGTTTAMEYSLDSSNGINGTWNACANGNTTVAFIEGTVYIREKAKPRNYQLITTVDRSTGPDQTQLDLVSYHVADGTISIPSVLKNLLQYRIGGIWRDLEATIIDGDKLIAMGIPFQPGKVDFRAKATATMLPSVTVSPSSPIEIGAIPPAPVLSYNDVTYKIAGLDNQYEYRINNGPWIPGNIESEFLGTDKVSLRKKATAATLAGLEQLISFTPNLNLYTVGINAVTSQITNTTTAMEYSLNSTDGLNGSWAPCTAGNTTVTNLSGNVYIREKAKPKNYRKVTTTPIQAKDKLTDSQMEEISYSIIDGTITLPNSLVGELQYRIGTGAWTHLGTTAATGGILFQQGELAFRRKADLEKLASEPMVKATLAPPAPAPTLLADDLKNKLIGLTADYEYKIGTGLWISGDVEGDLSGNKTVYVRKKATVTNLPSLEQTIFFTQNLDFSAVGVNVATNQITGTTNAMEYSLDSTNGTNGTWAACSNTNTNAAFIPGKVFLREKAYPLNYKEVAVITQPGEGPSIGGNFAYHVANGTISVPEELKNQLQYRFGAGNWIHLGAEATTVGIPFSPGKIALRFKGDAINLPSKISEWETILAPGAAPTLESDDVKNEIVGLTAIHEYKLGTGPWTSGEIEGDFSGNKTVQVRLKAMDKALPSLIQTIAFTTNLDLSPAWVDLERKIINGTATAMEYSTDSTDGLDGNWAACTNINTHLPGDYVGGPVYVRAKAQPKNFLEVPRY